VASAKAAAIPSVRRMKPLLDMGCLLMFFI